MAEDYTLYPEDVELTISCIAKSGGIDIGDIVNVRQRKNGAVMLGTGRKTIKKFFRIYVSGLSDDQIGEIVSPWKEGDIIIEKRRYCILLETLKEMFPSLDVDRLLDVNDPYEPFRPLDPDYNHALDYAPAIDYNGLIYDKATETFL